MIAFAEFFCAPRDGEGAVVEVSEARLRQVMAAAAHIIVVDEEWYLRTYPDVQEAVGRGTFSSAMDHYVKDGYFENRLPRPIVVENDWYLKEYPDVADGIRIGRIQSPQHHFEVYGFKEGRHPHSDWRL